MRTMEKLIVALLLVVAISIPACAQKETKQPAEAKEAAVLPANAVKTPSGLAFATGCVTVYRNFFIGLNQ